MNTRQLISRTPVAVLVALVLGSAALAATDIPSAGTTADCQVGNLNDPVGEPVPGIFQGEESYAYFIDPPTQCGCTEGGFTVETIYQLLYFDAQQVPATFQVSARLLVAVEDPTTGCWAPGPEVCPAPLTEVTVLEPGYFLVAAPLPDCPLQDFAGKYFLGLKYVGGAPAYLAIDDEPAACVEFIDRGNGWEDLFAIGDKTGGGKSIIFGDVLCGALSVPGEADSWGAIKTLFR